MPWPDYILDPNAGGGEDFIDIASAEAAIQADWGSNSGNSPVTLSCRSGTDNQASAIQWADFTPDPTAVNTITTQPAAGHEHGGVIGAGYVLNTTGGFEDNIEISIPYIRFRGISLDNATTRSQDFFLCTGQLPGTEISDVIARRLATDGRGSRGFAVRPKLVQNCLYIANGQSRGITTSTGTDSDAVYANNTFVAPNGNGDIGFSNAFSEPTLYNNVVCGFNTDYNTGRAFGAGSSNNQSADTSAATIGVGTVTGVDYTTAGVDFVDPTTSDYNPHPTGKLDGAGTSPPVVATDIAGNTRNDPDDVGAYAIAAAPPDVTFDGPDIVAQTGVEEQVFTFDEDGAGNVASRFTGATTYALSPLSDPLPAGLSVNATTGNIEGTPDPGSAAGSPYTNIIIRGSDT